MRGRCKINHLMRGEKQATLSQLSMALLNPIRIQTPFNLLTPILLPYPTLLYSTQASISNRLLTFGLTERILDEH